MTTLNTGISLTFTPRDFNRILTAREKLGKIANSAEIPTTIKAELFDQYQIITDVLNACGVPEDVLLVTASPEPELVTG